jgi:diguanylate cyclase (GGDEF)-like protein
MGKEGLGTYAMLSRLPLPKSYLGKILLAAFWGTHMPLVALVLYLLVFTPVQPGIKLDELAVVLVATLLGTAATLYVLYALLRPISLASGALRDYLNHDELPDLPTGFTDQAGRLMRDVQYAIEQLDEVIRSLEESSTKDHLTGAYNRRAGEELLAAELARARRDGSTPTVAVMDVDQFKCINDRYGHQAGDVCLKHVADAIGRNIREGDWFARWGGDEFVVVLWDTGSGASAKSILERIAGELAQSPARLPHGEKVWLTLSGGACRCFDSVRSTQEIIGRADKALYRAKGEGRAKFVYVP